MDNQIGLRPIAELFGMHFEIPNYQRGYRWTKQQVTDLLEDVNDYSIESNTFYCLQPLVVKRCELDEKEVTEKLRAVESVSDAKRLLAERWEVIDGQQRLTTIRILLTCLKVLEDKGRQIYSLSYATRPGSEKILNDLSSCSKKECEVNIDYFHMYSAYETINEWLSGKDEKAKEVFKDKLLNHVQFIWYEANDEDPIKVFTRLNIGKISLTNSELIKALFLNRSNFRRDDTDALRLSQQEIASEWDNIEYTLQNDEFWLFFHDTEYTHPTRIDYIFDLICDEKRLGDFKNTGNDKYRTFRYFYEYFKPGKKTDIKQYWHIVKEYFQILEEWFNDLEMYHYVGFLVSQPKNDIKQLLKEYKVAENKTDFLLSVKRKVLELVQSPDLSYQYETDGSDKWKCRPILLFHNIQTVINRNKNYMENKGYKLGVYYKFPFHLFKKESWDVEHINSLTTNEEDDVDTRKQWLLNVYCSLDDDDQRKKLIEKAFEQKSDEKINEVYNEIKPHVNTNDGWTDKEKNRIWNYALLDSSTNRSYGNSIFSGKRLIIIGKNKGKLVTVPHRKRNGGWEFPKETEADSSFVPPCTLNAFLKYYSTTLSDFNYWSKEFDAPMYENDIKMCIEQLKNEIESADPQKQIADDKDNK